MFSKQLLLGITTAATVGCANIPPVGSPGSGTSASGTPFRPTHPSHSPSLASIRAISPQEMQKYGGIMTVHNKRTNDLLSICHFSKVTIPSTAQLRQEYEQKTGKTWAQTGGDTYTVTARHCVDDMGNPAVDKRIDVVAIRSLNRLFEITGIVFRTIDKPPALERSIYDESTIGDQHITIPACIPHMNGKMAHCFELSGRTYSTGKYGQRSMYYKIADIIPYLEQAGRSCNNKAHISGTSGMIGLDKEKRAFGVISNGADVCRIATVGGVNAVINIEPLRNTLNSLPGQAGRTNVITN